MKAADTNSLDLPIVGSARMLRLDADPALGTNLINPFDLIKSPDGGALGKNSASRAVRFSYDGRSPY